MRYPNVIWLYFATVSITRWHHTHRVVTLLALTLLIEGFFWDDLRKILCGGQRMAANVRNGKKYCQKFQPRVGCMNVTDRRQADLR